MLLKVFLKLKKNLKTPSSGQIYIKKKQYPKNPQKKPKNPLGWGFFFNPGFFQPWNRTPRTTTASSPSGNGNPAGQSRARSSSVGWWRKSPKGKGLGEEEGAVLRESRHPPKCTARHLVGSMARGS
jgi:hypothetical protein